MVLSIVPTAATEALTAAELARRYDEYVAALWRGDDLADESFLVWLAGYWRDGPAQPDSPPAAISVLGAAGNGILWYETPSHVLGYVVGARCRCYRVPRAVLPPPVGTTLSRLHPVRPRR
jgi:hypothetical protein